MASPKSPATDSVVIFTPSIAGRWTVSVVINSSMAELRNLSMPTSLSSAWETQAMMLFAPLLFKIVHQQNIFYVNVADHRHALHFRRALAAFGDDGQFRLQRLRIRVRHLDTARIGTHHRSEEH